MTHYKVAVKLLAIIINQAFFLRTFLFLVLRQLSTLILVHKTGAVIVHPKSPTKTTQIILRFTGQVVLSVKDKETISLFERTQNIQVSPDNGNKVTILEAKQHSFPFNLEVPKGIELPSTMEVSIKNIMKIINLGT